MKDIDISEVFCEILSGLASIAVIVPFLDSYTLVTFHQPWCLLANT